jgi:hypothetical protein
MHIFLIQSFSFSPFHLEWRVQSLWRRSSNQKKLPHDHTTHKGLGQGVPRLGQPWLLTCTPSFSGSTFEAVKKHEKHSGRKDLFSGKISTQRGFPPFSPRGRVGLCRGEADPSLMTKLCVSARYMNNLKTS